MHVGTVQLAEHSWASHQQITESLEKLKVRGSGGHPESLYGYIELQRLKNEPIKELVSPEVAGAFGRKSIWIADKRANQPGKFTTFVAW